MTNKSTKSALLTSSISLLLCFAMLLGTTFAWFTDSATSAGNRIQAGNLDVKLLMWDGSDYVDISDKTGDIFAEASDANNSSKTLWEPGKTQVVYLAIENAGTLDLKYNVNIKAYKDATNTVNDIDMTPAMRYAITPDAQNGTGVTAWNSANAKAVELGMNKTQSEDVTLLKGQKHYFALSVHMLEAAGNEYKDASVLFDLIVNATQLNSEVDSFGPDYDKDALYPVVDAAGLAGALEEGKGAKLEANITLDETIEVTGDIAVDLNGFDLDASTNDSRPFEMADGATLTINGGDEAITCGAYGLVNIPAGNDATVVINGGKFTADTDAGSFIKPRGDGEIKIVLNDVEYTDNSANGYALDCTGYSGENLSVEINGGKFESTIGMLLPEGSKVNGAEIVANNTKNMQPAVYAMGDMTIENCIIKAAKSHAVAVAGGATLTVINCDVYAGSDANALAFQVFSSGGTINVTGGSYVGGYGTTGKMNSGRVAIIIINGTEVYRKG